MANPLTRGPHVEALNAELENWDGVTVKREVRGKHAMAVLSYRGKSTKVFYPISGGDYQGAKNHVSDCRKALRQLGAEQVPRGNKSNVVKSS